MYFGLVSDAVGHGKGKVSAEVFAEVSEALQDAKTSLCVALLEQGRVEGQSGFMECLENAVAFVGGEESEVGSATGVDGDADGHGEAMAKGLVGEDFDSMGGPVSEVEWAGDAGFEGIAAEAYMVEMQLSAALDEFTHPGQVAIFKCGGVAAEEVEEVGIANEGDFEGFGDSTAPVFIGQGVEKVEITEYGEGRGEGAEEIFLVVSVDSIFDADGGIILGEGGGGDADEAESAMDQCGGESDEIEKAASAHGEYEALAAESKVGMAE